MHLMITMHARPRQTDRQTDGQTYGRTSGGSTGANGAKPPAVSVAPKL